MDMVISKIMVRHVTPLTLKRVIVTSFFLWRVQGYAKRLVNADRTSLFLVDNRTKELYARVFDTGDDDVTGSNSMKKEIRFDTTTAKYKQKP